MNHQDMNRNPSFADPDLAITTINGMLAAFFCWVLIDWRINTEAAIWFWMITMICLLLRIGLIVHLLGGISLVFPLFSSPYRYWNRSGAADVSDLLFVGIWLLFMYFAFRFVDEFKGFRHRSMVEALPGTGVRRRPQTGLTGILWIPVAMIIGLFLMHVVPENPESRRIIRLTEPGLRTITFVWLLGLIWVLLHSGFGLVGWYSMKRDAAGLYIRSSLAQEFRSELSRIERQRVRKTKQPTTTNEV